jgi:hypothetical protein
MLGEPLNGMASSLINDSKMDFCDMFDDDFEEEKGKLFRENDT